jgi:hypothetical protein
MSPVLFTSQALSMVNKESALKNKLSYKLCKSIRFKYVFKAKSDIEGITRSYMRNLFVLINGLGEKGDLVAHVFILTDFR